MSRSFARPTKLVSRNGKRLWSTCPSSRASAWPPAAAALKSSLKAGPPRASPKIRSSSSLNWLCSTAGASRASAWCRAQRLSMPTYPAKTPSPSLRRSSRSAFPTTPASAWMPPRNPIPFPSLRATSKSALAPAPTKSPRIARSFTAPVSLTVPRLSAATTRTIGTAGWPTATKPSKPPRMPHSNTSIRRIATAFRTSPATAPGTITPATATAGSPTASASAGRPSPAASGFSIRASAGRGSATSGGAGGLTTPASGSSWRVQAGSGIRAGGAIAAGTPRRFTGWTTAE